MTGSWIPSLRPPQRICLSLIHIYLSELERYSWDDEKDVPEDRNDHTINANQYAWIPYRDMIGFEEEKDDKI